MSETHRPEYHPVHFVLADGDTLISYTAIMQVKRQPASRKPYQAYGFGNMFTVPPFRKQGFGAHMLEIATVHIKNSAAETALLLCDPTLEPFYVTESLQITHPLLWLRLFPSEKR